MKFFGLFICVFFLFHNTYSQVTKKIYLSGTGIDNTVKWEFNCSGGRNSHNWTEIPVPSCWELQGFGKYDYGENPDSIRGKEFGLYRFNFNVPLTWKGLAVEIVFEGSMTDTEIKINGKSTGPKHQGGFYEFRYDVSNLINYGRINKLEVTVFKHSSDESVNKAERRSDYWIFGGIFRPVYLEAKPAIHISSIAVDARANGDFKCNVFLHGASEKLILKAKLFSTDNKSSSDILQVDVLPDENFKLISGTFQNIRPWSPEFPELYTLQVSLFEGNKLLHSFNENIGFRTVEVREHDGIYINGTKIMFKGVCRHSFWPEGGRTTSRKISIDDILLMKSMNMNAVRMSHYPPDKHFLDACDSIGLYVLDELGGWQKSYNTGVGKKLVREMVVRDVNHPCIILWDNGNEGGWNSELDDEFIKYDIQGREVIHPRDNFRKTDTHHYIEYNYGTSDFFNGDQVFFPTEFLHGLYDGGLGAGLDDFWNLMLSKPLSSGGFLWVFSDESVVRTDKNGELDSDGNHAPDGILGPHREKEGSYYTIKEIWSPVFFEDKIITPQFNGVLNIENRYSFTDLKLCNFEYKLDVFQISDNSMPAKKEIITGRIESPSILPGQKGTLKINLPENWRTADVLYIIAKDPYNREINTWSWPIPGPRDFCLGHLNLNEVGQAEIAESNEQINLESKGIRISVEKSSGRLINVFSAGKNISLSYGPVLARGSATFIDSKIYDEGQNKVYEAIFDGNLKMVRWSMLGNGLVRLNILYRPDYRQPFYGINFNYPEKYVTGISWIGKGPYRVWKNRMKGTNFGFWEKKYNNTVTGESYDYPEFKGYHAGLYFIKLHNTEKDFSVYTTTDHLFFRLYTPGEPKGGAMNTKMIFPDGDISFLQGINAIGTKTQLPIDLGPQSQLNLFDNQKQILEIELFFDFR